jgi:hypothetical protein
MTPTGLLLRSAFLIASITAAVTLLSARPGGLGLGLGALGANFFPASAAAAAAAVGGGSSAAASAAAVPPLVRRIAWGASVAAAALGGLAYLLVKRGLPSLGRRIVNKPAFVKRVSSAAEAEAGAGASASSSKDGGLIGKVA